MDFRKHLAHFQKSRRVKIAGGIFGAAVAGLLIFHAGVAYGERQAFNRMRGFGHGKPPPIFGIFSHSFIPDGHGAIGTVTAVGTSTLTLHTRDGETETVRLDARTVVRSSQPIQFSDITVGENIAVIGEPDPRVPEQIVARLIRVLDPAPAIQTNSAAAQ